MAKVEQKMQSAKHLERKLPMIAHGQKLKCCEGSEPFCSKKGEIPSQITALVADIQYLTLSSQPPPNRLSKSSFEVPSLGFRILHKAQFARPLGSIPQPDLIRHHQNI